MWREDIDEESYQVPNDIIDLQFKINCESLPVDHIYALTQALLDIAPWLGKSPENAVNDIHGATTGNGWYRPEDSTDTVYLSRRTPLILRLHRKHLQQAKTLSNQTIEVAGNPLSIGKGKTRPLAKTNTLHARNVYFDVDNETDFLQLAAQQMKHLDIDCKKILCGKATVIKYQDLTLQTHTLMVADLSFPDAVKLQQFGIGEHRLYGCGIFMPHKNLTNLTT